MKISTPSTFQEHSQASQRSPLGGALAPGDFHSHKGGSQLLMSLSFGKTRHSVNRSGDFLFLPLLFPTNGS
jgi:hypothetical protein